MNNNAPAANNTEASASVLHTKVILSLQKHCFRDGSGLIPLSEVNRVLSWLYHCDKNERHSPLYELQKLNLIEVKPYHGIRINTKRMP